MKIIVSLITICVGAVLSLTGTSSAAAPSFDAASAYAYKSSIVEDLRFTNVRDALNSVGGGSIALVLGTSEGCKNLPVSACVDDSNVIYIDESVLTLSSYELRGLMAHEFAHVVTTVWVNFDSKWQTYAFEAFEGDWEWMADCMAVQRVGYTSTHYDYSCSSDQLIVASKLWNNKWSK